MARTRRVIPLDEKIEKAQAEVAKAKDKYDAAVEELNKLLKKKQEMEREELLRMLEASPRSYEEILQFLAGDQEAAEEAETEQAEG